MEKKIMVVDDEAGICSFIKTALKLRGHKVNTSTNPKEALETILKEPPHILITDVNMPGMGGIELANKAREAYPELPVIYMTGYTDIDLTANDCPLLHKPFKDLSELYQAVESAY